MNKPTMVTQAISAAMGTPKNTSTPRPNEAPYLSTLLTASWENCGIRRNSTRPKSTNAASQAQALCEGGHASADFRGGIDVDDFIEGEDVAGNLAGDGNVVGAGANISVNVPIDVKGLRKGDDITLDGAVHYGVLGEHVNVAFDGAVDARAVTEQEDVTFDGLVLGDFDSVPLAHFRRRGWWHGHGRDAAHSR